MYSPILKPKKRVKNPVYKYDNMVENHPERVCEPEKDPLSFRDKYGVI
jgi:hypothetical protein